MNWYFFSLRGSSSSGYQYLNGSCCQENGFDFNFFVPSTTAFCSNFFESRYLVFYNFILCLFMALGNVKYKIFYRSPSNIWYSPYSYLFR